MSHNSTLKVPNVIFDDKLVLDDGKQRVEFLFLGQRTRPAMPAAYLPKQKILCTGDACVMERSTSWAIPIRHRGFARLERMQQLDVQLVAPGHGPLATKELLEKQKRYFVELRQVVKKGITAKMTPEDISKNLDLAWYKQWTGVQPSPENVKYVYDEFTGRVVPWDLAEDSASTKASHRRKTRRGGRNQSEDRRAGGLDAGAVGGTETHRAGGRIHSGEERGRGGESRRGRRRGARLLHGGHRAGRAEIALDSSGPCRSRKGTVAGVGREPARADQSSSASTDRRRRIRHLRCCSR